MEPPVEAPAKPPLSDDEDEVEEELPHEAHYDSLEKASTPPGEYWALPQVKLAAGTSMYPLASALTQPQN